MQRVDKFLWFARLFKSRTLAATVVAGGRVRINGERCEKPSTTVKLGDVLTISSGSYVRIVKVLAGGERRGPATEARLLYEDLTPPAPSKEEKGEVQALRERGTGRPTKKERREITSFTRSNDSDD